jgi:hypothetical protein
MARRGMLTAAAVPSIVRKATATNDPTLVHAATCHCRCQQGRQHDRILQSAARLTRPAAAYTAEMNRTM